MNIDNNSKNEVYWFKTQSQLYDFQNKETVLRDEIDYMYMRINEIFKCEGLPNTIPSDLFIHYLQYYGFGIFVYVKENEITINKDKYKEGLYFFSNGVSLGGVPDYLYRPTIAIISNPALGYYKHLEINKDCVLVRNDVFLKGLYNINRKYSTLIAENYLTFRLYDITARLKILISSQDSKVAEGAKKMLQNVEKGDLTTILDTNNPINSLINTVVVPEGTNGMINLIEYHQYIRSLWLNELGIESNYNMKREALNSSETGINQASLVPLIDHMLHTIKSDLEKVNKMYGTNIRIDYASVWKDLQDDIENDLKENEKENEPQEEVNNDDKN